MICHHSSYQNSEGAFLSQLIITVVNTCSHSFHRQAQSQVDTKDIKVAEGGDSRIQQIQVHYEFLLYI